MTDYLLSRLIVFIPLLLSLTVHEWAHAWTAWRLGDDTAKMLGRVSLNPIPHIDPLGTLLLPLIGVPFGWAKPVPLNPLRFRPEISTSAGMLLTAVAGPIANVVLAAISTLGLVALTFAARIALGRGLDPHAINAAYQVLWFMVLINCLLAGFNLLPIPPLDGSRVAEAIMPRSLRPAWNQFAALGPLVLVAILVLPALFGTNILAWPMRWLRELINALTSAV